MKGPDGEYRYGQDGGWRHAHHHGGGGGDVAADEAKAGDGVSGHAANAERQCGGYQANIQRVAQVTHERGVADDAGVVADGGDEEEAGAVVKNVDFELQRGQQHHDDGRQRHGREQEHEAIVQAVADCGAVAAHGAHAACGRRVRALLTMIMATVMSMTRPSSRLESAAARPRSQATKAVL